MKLRQIVENEYAGLEDADEFEEGNDEHWCADCTSHKNFCDICGGEWCDCTGDRPTIDVENADINQCGTCGQWYCRDCGGKHRHPLLDYDSYQCRPCATSSGSTPIEESTDEYAGLEDADTFGDPMEALHAAAYAFLPQRIKYWGKADDWISSFIGDAGPEDIDPNHMQGQARQIADRVIEAYLEYGYELADTASGYPDEA